MCQMITGNGFEINTDVCIKNTIRKTTFGNNNNEKKNLYVMYLSEICVLFALVCLVHVSVSEKKLFSVTSTSRLVSRVMTDQKNVTIIIQKTYVMKNNQ